jgi:hypothetical protein
VKVGRGAKTAAAVATASAGSAGDWAQATDLSFPSSFGSLFLLIRSTPGASAPGILSHPTERDPNARVIIRSANSPVFGRNILRRPPAVVHETTIISIALLELLCLREIRLCVHAAA